MLKFVAILIILVFTSVANTIAADVPLAWNTAQGATGYKVQMTNDNGLTWSAGVDVGNVLNYTLLGVPDTGLVLFRVSAYNSHSETINTWAGAWYNGDWQPPNVAGGLGVQ